MKTKILFTIVFAFLAFFSNSANAQVATTSTSTLITIPETTGLETPQVPKLIQQINEAKAQLNNLKLEFNLSPVYKKNTSKLLRYELTSKDIALAILNPQTGSISIVVGTQKGKKMTFNSPDAKVTLTFFNGVNSRFKVESPEGGIILALKYLITPKESGSKVAIEEAMYEAIYVPSSSNLNDPEVLKYGAKYLDDLLNNVAKELYGLPSQSVPGITITEAIPPAMIKSLIYAEHTDTAAILNGRTQSAIDQLNILLATNGGDTYKYSVSSAGARGIAQFMPGTYGGLVKRHPEAFLIEDFVAGMSDHKNSIKAMYLLLDDYAGTVRVKSKAGFVSSRVFEYGAASYNGGTTRVIRAVDFFGDDWSDDSVNQKNIIQTQVDAINQHIKELKSAISSTKDKTLKADLQTQLKTSQDNLANEKAKLSKISSATLRNETVNYLKKIYKVIQHFNEQHQV